MTARNYPLQPVLDDAGRRRDDAAALAGERERELAEAEAEHGRRRAALEAAVQRLDEARRRRDAATVGPAGAAELHRHDEYVRRREDEAAQAGRAAGDADRRCEELARSLDEARRGLESVAGERSHVERMRDDSRTGVRRDEAGRAGREADDSAAVRYAHRQMTDRK